MTSTEHPRPPPLRPTRQRKAVVEAMESFADFRSAQEIHELLGERARPSAWPRSTAPCSGWPTPARSTCCAPRTARRSTGAAPTAITTTWSAGRCGATVEVEGPTVERWTRSIAAEHGYADVSHTLEIFGTCPGCSG